jgi:predicted transcriptional regulator
MVAQYVRPRRLTETERNTRRVWAAITKKPHASHREIARVTGIALSTVNDALHRLRDAGYISFNDGQVRTTQIIVPFVVIS